MLLIPTSAQDLFDRFLPNALERAPAKARELDTTLCFKIEGIGDWTIDCSGASVPTCLKGSSDNARCTVEIAGSDFAEMLANPKVGMELYYKGKLRISGDPNQARKIAALFDLARPETLR
jgi:alkyl sulfatase BDS1-like metallo-beta-lactamase superfamily hydrolase